MRSSARSRPNSGGSRLAHLGQDGSRHGVARGEFASRVIALHEAFAPAVDQEGALAPDGLGDQPPRGARDVESGRVELDELHVLEHRSGPIGDRYAVAGGHLGVGGLAVEAAEAAAGQDGLFCPKERQPRDLGGEHRAEALAVVRQEVYDEGVVECSDAGVGGNTREEDSLDLGPRGIAVGVDDAGARVAALPGAVEAARLPVEACAEGDQLVDALRPLANHGLDDLAVAKSLAHGHGVADVILEGVGLREHDRDPALRVVGVALAEVVLADKDDACVVCGGERGPQPRNPAAYDQHIGEAVGEFAAVEPHEEAAWLDVFLHCSRAPSSGRSIGKRITSRIDWQFVRSMVNRSMPTPRPPAGGIPCSSATM